jgi:hypothetical protein
MVPESEAGEFDADSVEDPQLAVDDASVWVSDSVHRENDQVTVTVPVAVIVDVEVALLRVIVLLTVGVGFVLVRVGICVAVRD